MACWQKAGLPSPRFLNVAADDVVYFPNPTTAVNMVARSLIARTAAGQGPFLRPGDEVLTTDHEYGALDRTWEYVCRAGGRSVRPPADSAAAPVTGRLRRSGFGPA